jgi:hypothetical protein
MGNLWIYNIFNYHFKLKVFLVISQERILNNFMEDLEILLLNLKFEEMIEIK